MVDYKCGWGRLLVSGADLLFLYIIFKQWRTTSVDVEAPCFRCRFVIYVYYIQAVVDYKCGWGRLLVSGVDLLFLYIIFKQWRTTSVDVEAPCFRCRFVVYVYYIQAVVDYKCGWGRLLVSGVDLLFLYIIFKQWRTTSVDVEAPCFRCRFVVCVYYIQAVVDYKCGWGRLLVSGVDLLFLYIIFKQWRTTSVDVEAPCFRCRFVVCVYYIRAVAHYKCGCGGSLAFRHFF